MAECSSKHTLLTSDSDASQMKEEDHSSVWQKVKKRYHLAEFSALPDYLRDNEFILSGYRVDFSLHQALSSIVKIHNETGNIWTHLLGFLVFLGLTVYTATSWPQDRKLPNLHDLSSLNFSSLNLGPISSVEFPKLAALQGPLQNLHLPESLSSCFHHSSREKLESMDTQRCIFANLLRIHLPESLSSCFASPGMERPVNSSQRCFLSSMNPVHFPDRLSSCFKSNLDPQTENPPEDQCMFAALWISMQSAFLHMPESLSSCFHTAEAGLGAEKPEEQCLLSLSADVAKALDSLMAPAQSPVQPITRWPFLIFLFGAMACLFTSSACHLLGCQSKQMNNALWRFDYAGIATLITASFYPPVYYGFLCQPSYRLFYLLSITIIGCGAVAVSLLEVFQKPSFRAFRAALYFGMGACGIVPTVHKLITAWDEKVVLVTTAYLLVMGALYGLGALFYASRVPERWLPGKFDYAGHSHQIFHVLVVAGALTHYLTGLEFLKWRDSSACPLPGGA